MGKPRWTKQRIDSLTKYAKLNDIPLNNVIERQSGRSTGLALIYIGKALLDPETRITVVDHYDTLYSNRILLKTCKKVVRTLDLDGFYFSDSPPTLLFTLDPDWMD